MEFDEFILEATAKVLYWFTIGFIVGLWLILLAFVIVGLYSCLEPCLSGCCKKLQRRNQKVQGNELDTLPTSSPGASGAHPPSNAATESSSTLVPSEQ